MATDVLTQGDVERAILRVVDELEDETDRFAAVVDLAAESEADYKESFARSIIQLSATAPNDRRVTAQEREARATSSSLPAFRTYKINDGRKQASKEALLSLRARLDALRSLGANIRAQT